METSTEIIIPESELIQLVGDHKILVRCSSIGDLMTEPKSKADKDAGKLSQTAIKKINAIYAEQIEGREKYVDSKYLEKGKVREEKSIDLLSVYERRMYRKNDQRLTNEYLTGEPDLFIGKSIHEAEVIVDIKTSWDRFSFLNHRTEKLNDDYFYQLQGYMDLTGAQSAKLVYTCVNSSVEIIDDEKYSAARRMGLIDTSYQHPEYLEICKQIEINHIYDIKDFLEEYPHFEFHNNLNEWRYDIPVNRRIHIVEIPRDQDVIDAIHSKVEQVRQFISENFYN